jgi:hypothetical protein
MPKYTASPVAHEQFAAPPEAGTLHTVEARVSETKTLLKESKVIPIAPLTPTPVAHDGVTLLPVVVAWHTAFDLP